MSAYKSEVHPIDSRVLEDIVIFDLETTGLSPEYSEIIQIAALRIKKGKIIEDDVFYSYVKPEGHIPYFITSLTGISDEDVRYAPSLNKVLKDFSRFCKNSLLVAHNGHMFDIRFLSAASSKSKNLRQINYIDSMHLSWLLWGRGSGYSHSLDNVIDRLDVSTKKHKRHDALGDVRLTAECVVKLLSKLKCKKGTCSLRVYKEKLPL